MGETAYCMYGNLGCGDGGEVGRGEMDWQGWIGIVLAAAELPLSVLWPVELGEKAGAELPHSKEVRETRRGWTAATRRRGTLSTSAMGTIG
jgi:hypothetical protein